MGAAQTGTGKTAAFTLPILHRLMPLANTSASPARHPVRALILTPTREPADQVLLKASSATACNRRCAAPWCSAADIGPQKEARGAVAKSWNNAGRLLDHARAEERQLSQVGILVSTRPTACSTWAFCPIRTYHPPVAGAAQGRFRSRPRSAMKSVSRS